VLVLEAIVAGSCHRQRQLLKKVRWSVQVAATHTSFPSELLPSLQVLSFFTSLQLSKESTTPEAAYTELAQKVGKGRWRC
jgi:hypothetical protein